MNSKNHSKFLGYTVLLFVIIFGFLFLGVSGQFTNATLTSDANQNNDAQSETSLVVIAILYEGIDGEGLPGIAGEEKSIQAFSLRFDIFIPLNPHASQSQTESVQFKAEQTPFVALADPRPSPIFITKEFDRSTPKIAEKLTTGEIIPSATINLYRVDKVGEMQKYFSYELKNVRIVSVKAFLPNLKDPASSQAVPREEIAVTYTEFKWIDILSSTEYTLNYEK